jgi:predicted O-methyltransferase YrrM
MATQKIEMGADLHNYLLSVSLREPEILQKLRAETAVLPNGGMQITPEQGQFAALLLRLMGAKRTIEVGVFTGYSSLITALTLPEDGQVVACDVSEAFTAVARRYWQEADVAHKIQLHLAPATETLAGLLAAGEAGQFDFAFIDADKENYDTYYENCLQLVRPGGLIVIDNVLWHGRVLDENDQSDDTNAIRAINKKLHSDGRVHLSLVPIGDGLTLLQKI